MKKQNNELHIPETWMNLFDEELKKSNFAKLSEKVRKEYLSKEIFPPQSQIFRAFELCAPQDVRVVILGQDPYHTPGVADGLAFSTYAENPIPPSLKNIFKEIASEYKTTQRESPDLTGWAVQGVLLLNTSLTVESGSANSHSYIGWNKFTNAIISAISSKYEHVVFILWGNDAREKRALIDTSKHLILESAHPSPLSAHRGFFGNSHFREANTYLLEHQRGNIVWN